MASRVILGVSLLLAVVVVPAAAAADPQTCEELFPEVTWVTVPADFPISAAGVPPGRAKRFAREIDAAFARIGSEIGGPVGIVCLVDPASGLSDPRLTGSTAQLHAALLMDEGALVISTREVGFVGPAAAYGLTHLALWQLRDTGWPEPLATAVAQWYRGRQLDRLDRYHVQVIGENFFLFGAETDRLGRSRASGEIGVDWGRASQPELLTWNPATNESPVGDLIDFAVAAEGAEVLADSDAARWSDRETAWRQALQVELTGRTTPTTGWIVGLALGALAVFAAAAIATYGIIEKRRGTRRRKTPPPGPEIA